MASTHQIPPSKHSRKSKKLIKNSDPLLKYSPDPPIPSEPVLNSLQVEEQQAFHKTVKLKKGTILPSSFPAKSERPDRLGSPSRGVIEAWLRETSERARDTSTPSRKRKRSQSPTATSQAYLQSREVLKDPAERIFTMSTPQKDKKGSIGYATTTSKKSAGSSRKHGHDWVKERLSSFRMHQEDREAFAKYPNFREKVLDIVGDERGSGAKPTSVKRFDNRLEEFQGASEDTLLDNLIPILIKDSRMVEPHSSTGGLGPERNDTAVISHPDNHEDTSVVETRDFNDDGIIRVRNTNFQGTFLPIADDEEVIRNLEKVEGMTNSRPDYIFGLSRKMYKTLPGESPTHESTELMRKIVPNMYDPVLVIEGKSYKGSLMDAQNQACRAGAALVNAARLLHQRIEDKDVEGADDRTFVFSSTLDPYCIEIWVHWAEVTKVDGYHFVDKAGPDGETVKTVEPYSEKRVVWHMNRLKSSNMTAPDLVKKFRGYFHNILDWACLTRYTDLQPFYQKIFAFEKLQVENRRADLTSKAASKTSGRSQSNKSVAFQGVSEGEESEEVPTKKGKGRATTAAPNTRRKANAPAPATAESDEEIPAANTRSRKPARGSGK